jgi:DNA-binding FadR family transcriptional regulator
VSAKRENEEDASAMTGSSSDSMFRAIRGTTALEETIERLLHAIKLGIVLPGEALPNERELADRFSVGRMTLRDALAALREAGLIESRPGRGGGSFVRADALAHPPRLLAGPPLTEGELRDVLPFRRAVESEAARSAAMQPLTDSDHTMLYECLRQTSEAPLQFYRQADSRLHLAVAELSGSQLLIRAVAEAEVRIHDLLAHTPLLPTKLRSSNQQHEAIVDAIVAGDPQSAHAAMLRHVDATGALLRGFLGLDRSPASTAAPRNPSAVRADAEFDEMEGA